MTFSYPLLTNYMVVIQTYLCVLPKLGGEVKIYAVKRIQLIKDNNNSTSVIAFYHCPLHFYPDKKWNRYRALKLKMY